MEAIRICKFLICLIILTNLASCAPPELPVLIHGKVLSINNQPIGSATVTARWTGLDGARKFATIRTFSSQEAVKLGHPELEGRYIFQQGIDAQKSSKIEIVSMGANVSVDSNPGVLTEAPDIIVKVKSGIFDKIASYISSLIGGNNPDNGKNLTENNSNPSLAEKNLSMADANTTENYSTTETELNNESYQALRNRTVLNGSNKYAPVLGFIPAEISACEGSELFYPFNISDLDATNLDISVSPDNIFSVSPEYSYGKKDVQAKLYSAVLDKSKVGSYPITIFASDGVYLDFRKININVIEVNNPPEVQDIGIQTIELSKLNKQFSYQVVAEDVEDENQNSGNLKFNLGSTGERKIFNIDRFGKITANLDNSSRGVYDLGVCVSDKGITSAKGNASLCSQSSKTICKNFSLTVTENNRNPQIVSAYPAETAFNYSGAEEQHFNISASDPDGTSPEVYWYADGNLKSAGVGKSFDMFNWKFSCPTGENHNVSVEISDGLKNDSLTWNFNIEKCQEETKEKTLMDFIQSFFNSALKKASIIKKFKFIYFLIFILFILALVIVLRVVRIIRIRNHLKELKSENERY